MKKYLSMLTTIALSAASIFSTSSILNSYVKNYNLINVDNLHDVIQPIDIVEYPIFADNGETTVKTFEKNVIVLFSDPSKLKYIELTDIKSHVDFHINGKDYYYNDQSKNSVIVSSDTKFIDNSISHEGNMNKVQQTVSYDYDWNQKAFIFKFVSVETVTANNEKDTQFVRGYFTTSLKLNLHEF
ncbi:hypothetical protein [Spiroplasma endosymbiont of Villa modesta]|uniref:hypothetical protein n=1 Tax=Spiroplasma endosymbiont of Villa modesta TaxID=3066293 RepID=UPI00313AF8AC